MPRTCHNTCSRTYPCPLPSFPIYTPPLASRAATWNGADVAVKVIVHTNAAMATKIAAEVELSMMLRHPNIVATYHAITRHSAALHNAESVWESIGHRSSGLVTTPSLPRSRFDGALAVAESTSA